MPFPMAQGKSSNVPQPAQMQNSLDSHVLDPKNSKFNLISRVDMVSRICLILQRKVPATIQLQYLLPVAKTFEITLMNFAKSEKEYSDSRNLEHRIDILVRHLRKRKLEQSAGQSSTPTHALGTPTSTVTPSNNLTAAAFQSGSLRPNNFTSEGSSLTYEIPNSLPQITRNNVPLANNGLMTSQELLSSTHFSTSLPKPLLQPAGQFQAASHMQRYTMGNAAFNGPSNRYGVVTSSGSLTGPQDTIPLISNHMLRVNSQQQLYPAQLQGMQQTPLPQQLAHGFHQQARHMEHRSQQLYPPQLQKQDHLLYEDNAYWTQQTGLATSVQHEPSLGFNKAPLQHHEYQGQCSQQLYPAQLQKQEHLPYEDTAYWTQLGPTGLDDPVKHEPTLDFNKEALQQQATNVSKPSELQYQQNVGAQIASVHSNQLNSSLSFQPNPHQNQPAASVQVQRQSSIQNSTQISEKIHGESEHIEVNNLCERTHMNPEAVCPARAPIIRQTVSLISRQAVSPGNTAERKRLWDGNTTSSKQVNEGIINQRRLLLFMFHAGGCTETADKCKSKYCGLAKELLKHIKRCKAPDCTYRWCPQTRELIHHYKKCEDKSCSVCMFVKDFRKKHNTKPLHPREAKCCSASLKCRPKESSESRQAYNKGGALVDDDLQPSMKRPKIAQPSQNVTPETERKCGVSLMDMKEKDGLQSYACKSVMPMDTDVSDASIKLPKIAQPSQNVTHETESKCGVSSMDMKEKDVLQSDACKSVMPMDTNVSEASRNPITRKLEKNAAEDDKPICLTTQGKSKCTSAPKEENVKQSMDVVDASKMEISSLVELFTPEQVNVHIRSLHQWEGQSKIKADKKKAMERSMSENSCQLCAVERLVFEPVPIYCTPCGARIKRNIFVYSVATGESRPYVCAPCYNRAHENSVSADGISIPKARLEKRKNDEQVEEGWVQCDKCLAWQHQICALFNSRRNHGEATKYTCPNCYIKEVAQGERKPLPESAIPGAKSLPVTTLSNHIEQRLFKKLEKERQERARIQRKRYDEVPGAESLTVRVVASVDKVLEVKQRFFELFREENYPSEFPYKSKAILLFQKIESVEVCIFGMFVQEFGTNSGPPNQRRVYISYLDSVKYFRPEVRTVYGEALRTFVYHEILIGYLDYCKKRGFTSCYIWACPPLKGEDYILNCHPEIQKMPKTDKLREWYMAMLKKASKEDVVVECTNFYDHFFTQSGERRANVTAARLPYFDGDYWPGAAEDLIRQMNQEDDGTMLTKKGLNKKVNISKRSLRVVGQSNLSVNASKDRLMMEKLGEIICPLKEDFIMVHLQPCCKHCSTLMVSGNRWVCNQCKNFQICDKCYEVEQKRVEKEKHPINQKEKHSLSPVAIEDIPTEIEDKDDNLESEFFDNRQAFLSLSQGNNYQYDTLRRAKHSSMMLLYHLHNPTAPAFATICTICQREIQNAQGWHCEVCPGYDVCNACHSNASINHPHNLINRSSSTGTVVQQNGQANQNYQIQLEMIKNLLVHVAACRYPQCQYERCKLMKLCFRHCIACKIGPGGCRHCKRFWNLIRLHARSCRDSQCTVPKCRDFRAISNRKQQQSDERRRAAVTEMMRQRAAETNGA